MRQEQQQKEKKKKKEKEKEKKKKEEYLPTSLQSLRCACAAKCGGLKKGEHKIREGGGGLI